MCGQLLPTAQLLASSGRLSGPPAAYCLANLAQLLTGCVPSSNGSQQQQQQQSARLADAQFAEAYVEAAVQLLVAAGKATWAPSTQQQQQQCGSSSSGSRTSTEVLQEGCSMLGTQQHLLPLLQTLQQHSPAGTGLWAGYCVHLLQESGSPAARNQGLGSSVLSVLAFAPKLLPSLWNWLARTAGLPLEAPLQASRGLDIAGGLGAHTGLYWR